MQKVFLLAIFSLFVLIPSVFALDQSVNIPMSASQATNPISVSANNGTNYFSLDPNGQIKLAANHKLCLDNACTTYLVSDGTKITLGSTLTLSGNLNAGGFKITNLGTPSSGTDAAITNHLGLLGSLVTSVCNNGQSLVYNSGNTTWICSSSVGAAITSINADSTAAQIIQGQSGNTTVSSVAGTTTIGLGTNPVITGGSSQVVTKGLTVNSLTFGGTANANNQRLTLLANPTLATDALPAGRIGNQPLSFNASPSTNQVLTYSSNGTAIWATTTSGVSITYPAGLIIYQNTTDGGTYLKKMDNTVLVHSVTYPEQIFQYALNSTTPSNGVRMGSDVYVNNGTYNLSPNFTGFLLHDRNHIHMAQNAYIQVPNGYSKFVWAPGMAYATASCVNGGGFPVGNKCAHFNIVVDGGTLNETGTPQRLWTAIEMNITCTCGAAGLQWNTFENMIIFNSRKVINFDGDSAVNALSEANANNFYNIYAQGFVYGIVFNYTHAPPNYNGGKGFNDNNFINLAFENSPAIMKNGTWNIQHTLNNFINVFFWDRTGFIGNFSPNSTNNYISGGYMTSSNSANRDFVDQGTHNQISDVNYPSMEFVNGRLSILSPNGIHKLNLANTAISTDLTIIPASLNNTQTFSGKQIMGDNSTIAGLGFVSISGGDPTFTTAGDIWYRSDTATHRTKLGSTINNFLYDSNTQTIPGGKTFSGGSNFITGTLTVNSAGRVNFGANGALRLSNPAGTFSYYIMPSAITHQRNATIPLITTNDTFAMVGFQNLFTAKNDFGTGNGKLTNHTFSQYGITLRNPSDNFGVQIINPNNNGHNYTLSLPALSSNATLMTTGSVVTSATGTANNVTVSASTGAVTWNLGSNVVVTNGNAQNFTSGKKVQFTSSTTTSGFNLGSLSSWFTSARRGDVGINGTTLTWQDNTNTTRHAGVTSISNGWAPRQFFNTNSTTPAMQFVPVTADPSSIPEGSLWYRSDTHTFRLKDSATDELVNSGLTQTISGGKTFSGTTTISGTANVNNAGRVNFGANGNLRLSNPAGTFSYYVIGSAITHLRNMTLPLIVQNETFAVQPQLNFTSPANQTGTTSLNNVMWGGNATFSAKVTGRAEITVSGYMSNSLINDGCRIAVYYFTTQTDGNQRPLTGTLIGTNMKMTEGVGGELKPFSKTVQVTGLSTSAKTYFDLSFAAITTGTCTVSNVDWSIKEL